MPSKKSKKLKKLNSPWKQEQNCSEKNLRTLARDFSNSLQSGDWVCFEGPLGAGKTTFASEMIEALGVKRPAEGSPTFPIVHEYVSNLGPIFHIDLYRLKSNEEIEQAGIEEYFWNRSGIVLVEWLSLHPEFSASVYKANATEHRLFKIEIKIESEKARNLQIFREN